MVRRLPWRVHQHHPAALTSKTPYRCEKICVSLCNRVVQDSLAHRYAVILLMHHWTIFESSWRRWQVKGAEFSDGDLDKLTHHIQFGGDEVSGARWAVLFVRGWVD